VLVLTRKKGERILIGDDIVVTLIDIRGDGVRIGFDAPRGVPIQRAEVVTAVTEANTEAAATSAATGELLVGLLRGARRTRPPLTRRPDPRPTRPGQRRPTSPRLRHPPPRPSVARPRSRAPARAPDDKHDSRTNSLQQDEIGPAVLLKRKCPAVVLGGRRRGGRQR
jgi:carbon storage regulator